MTSDVLTLLDAAHAALEADPENDAWRLRFFERLSDGEMLMLLEDEPVGETLRPRVFPLEDGPVVLIFDRDDRLAAFSGGIAPYAAMPGRVIARMLQGQGIGLGVNLGVAPSSMLLPPEALDWLAETLEPVPEQHEAHPSAFSAPRGIPETLLSALDAKLAKAEGMADCALLAAVSYADGRQGHILAFLDARDGSEPALAQAVREALVFSGIEAGALDVTFLPGGSAAAGPLAAVALRFDLNPGATAPAHDPTVKAPGLDPARPPKLR